MLRLVEKIMRVVYNKITKEQHETDEPRFGVWYRASEEFRKVNPTTSHHEITQLFDKEINYYG